MRRERNFLVRLNLSGDPSTQGTQGGQPSDARGKTLGRKGLIPYACSKDDFRGQRRVRE